MKLFKTQHELLLACMNMLDGICATYQAIQKAQSPEAFEGRGIVVPESQVLVALSGQIDITPHSGFREYFDQLKERIAASPRFPVTALLDRLCTTDFQRMAVLIALAPELNRKYERIFAFLQDNINERRATIGLAADLYGIVDELDDRELYDLYDDRHPLNRFVLQPFAQSRVSSTGLGHQLAMRQSALLVLSGELHLPEPLSAACTLIRRGSDVVPLTHGELLEQASVFVSHFLKEGGGDYVGCLQLYGSEGSGRRFALRHVAAKADVDVLCIDCNALMEQSADDRRELVEAAVSYCDLTESVPALLNFDFRRQSEGDRSALARWLLREFGETMRVFAVSGAAPLNLTLPGMLRPLPINLPPCSIGQQMLFWRAFLKRSRLPLSEGADVVRLANVYSLSPGQIERVLGMAEMECLSRGEASIGTEAIALSVQRLCRPRLTDLTQPLSAHFTWDDLVLEEEPLRMLRQLCDRVRYRWQVGEQWGFERRIPYGKGISVLLYGPPGTGKTMAAQVLAREFGLDAYRVDMSRIMDKYIGETEKKLAELFDAAKDSNAILFFDEADALFAKRTEITDARDKYANVETAYLLQRIEEHNGISILATNVAQNFDEAFKRRISFMVHVAMPSVETRKKLWHSMFPPEAPLRAGAGLDFFAERFELSGSSIKNICISAAYIAAAQGGEITRDCIAQALKDEYLKTGRVIMEQELY